MRQHLSIQPRLQLTQLAAPAQPPNRCRLHRRHRMQWHRYRHHRWRHNRPHRLLMRATNCPLITILSIQLRRQEKSTSAFCAGHRQRVRLPPPKTLRARLLSQGRRTRKLRSHPIKHRQALDRQQLPPAHRIQRLLPYALLQQRVPRAVLRL